MTEKQKREYDLKMVARARQYASSCGEILNSLENQCYFDDSRQEIRKLRNINI